jgi:hypothetical protein
VIDVVKLICLLVLIAMVSPATAEVVFYVSSSGNDTNPGTRQKPFATLTRARAAVRKADAKINRTVIISGGVYELNENFTLGIEDSGTPTHPVTWRAATGEKVRLIGGRAIPSTAFRPVTDPAILARLDPLNLARFDPSLRSKVVCANLKKLGIGPGKPFETAFHGPVPGPELFFNDKRMELAHWPNTGWATIKRIIDSGSTPSESDSTRRPGTFEYAGDRPAHWRATAGVWLQGYWCYDWYDQVIKIDKIDPQAHTITLAAPHVYGLHQGNPSPRRYRAINLLEELDTPGEFYIDRAANLLYFWPPSDLTKAQVIISTLDAPIITLQGASFITLRNLTVACGLRDGIEVRNGASCAIEACEVCNMREMGISIVGGQLHRVEACDIHDTGTGGLRLEGGDRKTLTSAGHQAVNNHIWRFSMQQRTGAYALTFGGVGNYAAHNLIHDAPHQAIAISGNDHIFEYNEIYNICTESDDCGALYKGRNPSCRGNQIRFNYWHDIGRISGHGSAAIYFDDGDGGDTVFGNIFYRCGDPGKGSFGTVFSHGGHDNRAENNIFIECKRALGSAPWDDKRWRDALHGGQNCFFPDKLLKEVDITKPPYTTRYPELVNFMNPPIGAPRVNHATRNVLVKCDSVISGNWQFTLKDNLVTEADPGFLNAATHDFRLRPDSQVFTRLPGFVPIPFEKIGLQRSALRPILPSKGKLTEARK